jgi:hypothetical protein
MRSRIDFGRSIGPLCVGLAALTFKTNPKSKNGWRTRWLNSSLSLKERAIYEYWCR